MGPVVKQPSVPPPPQETVSEAARRIDLIIAGRIRPNDIPRSMIGSTLNGRKFSLRRRGNKTRDAE